VQNGVRTDESPNGPWQFVSGPLSANKAIGVVGALLHVAAWVTAVVADLSFGAKINGTHAPAAKAYWDYGYFCLLVGFVVLLVVTIMHALPIKMKIPGGGTAPFLMTLFIGGALISLMLTVLQLMAIVDGAQSDFLWIDTQKFETPEKRTDELAQIRNLLLLTMTSKIYIVQFLRNNQEVKRNC